MILALGLTVILGASEWLVFPPIGDDLTPPAPQFVGGLPGWTSDGRGTYLIYPLDQAVRDLLDYCVEDYPSVCRTAIESGATMERARCAGQVDVLRAQYRADKVREIIEAPKTIPRWVAIGLVAGALILGAAGGYGVARMID